MDGFKLLSVNKIDQFPTTSGVYYFLGKSKNGKNQIFYIGKAINLKSRVKNHFLQPTYKDGLFVKKTKKIGYIETNSEIEALILEAKLIKKHRPEFNIVWMDDKNYFFIAIAKERFPKIFITHQPNSKKQNQREKSKNGQTEYIGPFIDGRSLKQALKALRKILPYRTCRFMPKKPCLYFSLKLCPAPCIGKIEEKIYRKDINILKEIFNGKKSSIVKKMKKEMAKLSEKQNFEKAALVRNKIFSIENAFGKNSAGNAPRTNDWRKTETEMRKIINGRKKIKRIEAYDISNIQGKQSTGSMVVFTNGFPDKNNYRKFKIKISGKPNDTAMIKEVLERRFLHKEWKYPELILIDGGKPQIGAAIKVRDQIPAAKSINIIALAKRNNELFIGEKKKPILLSQQPRGVFNLVLKLRDEAHRFAISYHKKLRKKQMFEG